MQKGQGALEYLLLIGGAILVTVIVIALLVGLGGSSGDEAIIATANAQCAKYPLEECDLQTVTSGNQSFKCYPFGINTCRARLGIEITACGGPPGGFQQGGVYRLGADISTSSFACLSIDKDNVTLNCMDHKITNTLSASEGINLTNVNNVFISNCSIETTAALGAGIDIFGNNKNNVIRNNKINVTGNAIVLGGAPTNNSIYKNDACLNPLSRILDNTTGPQNPASGNNKCGTTLAPTCVTSTSSALCPCIPCS